MNQQDLNRGNDLVRELARLRNLRQDLDRKFGRLKGPAPTVENVVGFLNVIVESNCVHVLKDFVDYVYEHIDEKIETVQKEFEAL